MLTHFEIPEDSKELYFKLSNSFHITMFDDRSSTSKFAGLYAIFKNDVCMYVGQSQNLASRLSQHLSGKYKTADKVIIYSVIQYGCDDFFTRSKDSRKEILENNEKLLMKELQPVENLLLPDSDFCLDEKKRFEFFFYKKELADFFNIYFSTKLYISKNSITATNDDNVSYINDCPVFDLYHDYRSYMDKQPKCKKTGEF